MTAHSTAAEVRAILPSLLKDDDDLGYVESGTLLTLTAPAYGVPTILKDGTAIALTTNFAFSEPTQITLSDAASGEQYIAQVYRGARDADLTTIIAKADRIIDAFWENRTTPAAAYLTDWSAELGASIYLRQYSLSLGDKDGIETAQAMEDRVFQLMQNYKGSAGATVVDWSASSSLGGMERTDVDSSIPSMHFDQGDVPSYE